MKRGLIIDPRDSVGMVLEPVEAGETVDFGTVQITAREPVAMLHKMALRELAPGDTVLKYGACIGYATKTVHPGEHIHVHNLDSEKLMK